MAVFDQDNACTVSAMPAVGGVACTIDASDRTTDAWGNVMANVGVGDVKSLRIWAWTGSMGTSFDKTVNPAVLDISPRSGASTLVVSDDLPPTAQKVRFGDSVTFTFQLVDDDNIPVARSGFAFSIRIQESRDRGVEQAVINKETGPNGAAQVTYRFTDPSSGPGDLAQLDLDIENSGGMKVDDRTTTEIVTNDRKINDALLDWSDETAAVATLKLSLTKVYRVASSEGAGSATTVRASLTDQYGAPIAREPIAFTSNDSDGVPSGVRRVTNSSGVASLSYQRDSSAGGVETITARSGRLTATARQYWVVTVSGSRTGSGTVRVIDFEDKTMIVVSGDEPVLVRYDNNDQYTVGEKAVSLAAFEEALTIGDGLAYQITDPSESTVNSFTLTNR